MQLNRVGEFYSKYLATSDAQSHRWIDLAARRTRDRILEMRESAVCPAGPATDARNVCWEKVTRKNLLAAEPPRMLALGETEAFAIASNSVALSTLHPRVTRIGQAQTGEKNSWKSLLVSAISLTKSPGCHCRMNTIASGGRGAR